MAVLSELSHVFCCFLPSVFSIMTVLVGMGALGAMPLWFDGLHDVMHVWEVPIIGFSALILVLGWSLHFVSKRMDCHSTGCGHEPCAPKKKSTTHILKIATFLFVINVSIYGVVHMPSDKAVAVDAIHVEHDHHGHQH